jgi:hypothetical protein
MPETVSKDTQQKKLMNFNNTPVKLYHLIHFELLEDP